jgi:hypothetical protein
LNEWVVTVVPGSGGAKRFDLSTKMNDITDSRVHEMAITSHFAIIGLIVPTFCAIRTF